MTENIVIKGVRVNNLKNVSLTLPRNKFIVITGLSGSGKSSLAFDTIYAEGQRRYVESLSAYTRQFIARMEKPNLDSISGLSPAIAIEQKNSNKNPRSTVGTVTEIYDYIKLLYARIGRTFSPISGKEVTRDSVSKIVDEIMYFPENTAVYVYAPLLQKENPQEYLLTLKRMGFSRLGMKKGKSFEIVNIDDANYKNLKKYVLLIDRFKVKNEDNEFYSRAFDSIQTAYYEGEGICYVQIEGKDILEFSNKFERDGMKFEKVNENFFSFNNPYGACPKCEGYGSIIGLSEDLVVPDQKLSVYEGAIALWRGEKMGEFKYNFINVADKLKFPIHKPYNKLSKEDKNVLWHGRKPYFQGLYSIFEWIESQSHHIQYRVMAARYQGKTLCPDCEGTRLRKDADYVKIDGKSIRDLVLMPITDLQNFFAKITLNDVEKSIVERIFQEINSRINYLIEVGLGYLTLNRASGTLSGGEAQKIRLATVLGSTLTGALYILDEPSIGLHRKDTERLIKVLKKLRDKGNTVIVVEHDEKIIRAADHVTDIGYLAGINGGNVVFNGTPEELLKVGETIETSNKDIQKIHYSEFLKNPFSLTAAYLSGKCSIEIPSRVRQSKYSIELIGATENNLKNINVKIPLNSMVVVTGVSGSGKTTLIKQTLYAAVKKHIGQFPSGWGKYVDLIGDIKQITNAEMIDQDPIGRSTRSNPATYIKAYDDIRELYANQPLSKLRGYRVGFFSFNTDGGRCEVCKGDGKITVEMQFMADIHLTCEECGGKRFKQEVLDVKYHDKTITDILDMSIDEAIDFFSLHININKEAKKMSTEVNIVNKLKSLQDVGLGYLKLGQSSDSLSGGEAQRVKLAYYLSKGNTVGKTLFVFDEPTTGLHIHDIHKLKDALNALIDIGHSVIIIEHHPDIIKLADYVIELGPEGGVNGGNIIFAGARKA